ncbi:MAG: ATP-binding protein [Sphingomonadaceae bacterium]|nr:ATP-binding protein [Sphingomonadaceae bacterium]
MKKQPMPYLIYNSLPSFEPPVGTKITSTIVVIGPNAGGARKTSSAMEIASAAIAVGHKVLFVCADDGLAGLSNSLRLGRYAVQSLPEVETAEFGDNLLQKAEEIGATFIIIDLGANVLLKTPNARMVRGFVSLAKSEGWATFVVISLISPKTGIVEDGFNFGNRFAAIATVVLFFHGRETGADFSDYSLLLEASPLTVEVPSKHPAMVHLLNKEQLIPLDFALNAGAPFEMVAGIFANNLIKFATQPAIAQMLGCVWSAPPALTAVAKRAPCQQYNNATERWEVFDDVLMARQNEIIARRNLYSLSPNSDDATVASAARVFIKANSDRNAIEHSAKNSAGSSQ